MKHRPRRFLQVGGLLATGSMVSACANGIGGSAPVGECATEAFPTQEISLVVPYAAGGGTDTSIRPFAEAFEEAIGESVVVINQPGGGGVVGTASAANGGNDGHTLLAPIHSLLTVQPDLNPDVNYELEDFTAIAMASVPQTLAVGADQPFETMDDFLAAAEESPGSIGYGTPGVATDNDIAGRALQLEAGVELQSMPFAGGGAETLRSVLRGDVESAIIVYSTIRGSVEAGDLRMLSVLGPDRIPDQPDVPSLSDLGIDADAVPQAGFTLALPEGADPEVIEVLECAAEIAVENEDLNETWGSLGINADYRSAEESRTFLEGLRENSRGIIEQFPDLREIG